MAGAAIENRRGIGNVHFAISRAASESVTNGLHTSSLTASPSWPSGNSGLLSNLQNRRFLILIVALTNFGQFAGYWSSLNPEARSRKLIRHFSGSREG